MGKSGTWVGFWGLTTALQDLPGHCLLPLVSEIHGRLQKAKTNSLRSQNIWNKSKLNSIPGRVVAFSRWRNWSWGSQCICSSEWSRSITRLRIGENIWGPGPAFILLLHCFTVDLPLTCPSDTEALPFIHPAYTSTYTHARAHTHTFPTLPLLSVFHPS